MKYYNIISALLCSILLVACNDFLDTMPDNRTELDTEDKVASLLTSAYPSHSIQLMQEFGTDNIADNGVNYSYQERQQQAYNWEQITTTNNDDPKYVWGNHYEAVANANQALQAINDMGNPASLAPQRGEALICRAYALFDLANAFCMPYNPETADSDLGLPYPTEPETQLVVTWTRGNMTDLYKQINADIEEGLPLIDDAAYTIPKYHFNQKAAYAFAARFNLFYMNYDKAIEYATEALGSNPASMMRDFSELLGLGASDLANTYVAASNPANLILMTAYSLAGRAQYSSSWRRYGHNRPICLYETYWVRGPWGSGSVNNVLYFSHKLYGNNMQIRFPRLTEFFEYTDKTAGTGYAHVVNVPFTSDLTILVRAEAEALKNDFDAAVADLNIWQEAHCYESYSSATRTELTISSINSFIDNLDYAPDTIYSDTQRSIRKKMTPQGFTVNSGTQENLLQLILHCQRLETIFLGERWDVIKRYGIQVTHLRDGEQPIVLPPGDKRYALQLPQDVIDAGLEANPR